MLGMFCGCAGGGGPLLKDLGGEPREGAILELAGCEPVSRWPGPLEACGTDFHVVPEAGDVVDDGGRALCGGRLELEPGFGVGWEMAGGRAVRGEFEHGQFPVAAVDARAALVEEPVSVGPDKAGDQPPGFGRTAAGGPPGIGAALSGVEAAAAQRAIGATRVVGQTDRGAEFHEGLVEGRTRRAEGRGVRATGFGQGEEGNGHASGGDLDEARGECPGVGGSGGEGSAAEPTEHTGHVAVHDRGGEVEGGAGDGARGVGSDSGQFEDLVVGVGEPARMLLEDEPGGAAEVVETAVIAEPFPEFAQSARVGSCEGGEVGQLAHPTFPVGLDGGHAGLLEHDLRDPDGVGIAGAAPGQVAGVVAEPTQEDAHECAQFRGVPGMGRFGHGLRQGTRAG